MQVPFLDLKAQYKQIESEVVPAVTEAMAAGMFIGGPQVAGFEEEFADFCDSKYCVGVNSGTDALRFALMAAGVGPGDAVITVPNTFIATTEAISQVGATPVFVDVDPHTYNMDPQKLIEFVEKGSPLPFIQTPNTKYPNRLKAIFPVHLYGQPADMDPILEIAQQYDLVVIEDACQAHGASYKDRKAGSLGIGRLLQLLPRQKPGGLRRGRGGRDPG